MAYRAPNLVIPYTIPNNIPPALAPIIKPIYIAFQNIITTLILYCGIGPRSDDSILSSNGDPTAILASNVHRFYIQSSETIAQGALVNLYNNGVGVLFVRNANATTNAKQCDGYCSQLGGIAAGAVGEVILNDGVISGLSGLTVGARYYCGTTNGAMQTTAPVAAGNLEQQIGIALTTTDLRFFTGKVLQH